MSVAPNITVNLDERLRKLLQRGGKPWVPELAKTMLKGAYITAQELAREAPHDTNQLARSFLANVGFVENTATVVKTRTWSPLPYAGVMDAESTTIIPKTAKALAIPFSSSPKANTMWPRDWPAKQLFRLAVRGRSFLVEAVGKGKLMFHYTLKESVVVHGTGYVGRARKKARPKVVGMISAKIKELLRK